MQTIKIGEFEYSRTKIKNNILRVYADSLESEKNDWYKEANTFGSQVSDFLSAFSRLSVSKRKVLGIVSALSPLKEWNKNKELAVDLILSGDCGHMKNNKQKALDILALKNDKPIVMDEKILGILNGDKTKRFYLNMMYPSGSGATLFSSLYPGGGVTVDRHAIAIAIGRTATEIEQVLTPNKYTFIENCYKITADALGLTPLHLQSITWQAWKRIKKEV